MQNFIKIHTLQTCVCRHANGPCRDVTVTNMQSTVYV